MQIPQRINVYCVTQTVKHVKQVQQIAFHVVFHLWVMSFILMEIFVFNDVLMDITKTI